MFILVKVVTTTRRYQSAAGYPVPNFLPDYQSEWFRHNYKLAGSIESTVVSNNRSFRESIEEFRQENGTRILEQQQSTGSMDLLGMLVYKVNNREDVVPNVMRSYPTEPIKIADFDPSIHAQIPYKYSTNILGNEKRSEDDRQEIRHWIKSLPPRPTKSSKGFEVGAAAKWYRSIHGDSEEFVLPRVLNKLKDPRLKRPSQSAYDGTHTLATDQAILDSLPEQNFFTAIGNSHNAGQVSIFFSLS
jgi:hypothetical protein